MPLTATSTLISEADARGGAVAAFNVITLEHAEGIIAGAEASGIGVILQVSQNAVAYHGGAVQPLAAALRELEQLAQAPTPCRYAWFNVLHV